LETDHEFLKTGGVFTDELIDMWIDYKRTQESYAIRNRPHPYEMSRILMCDSWYLPA
jgi:glutamine synthetase